MNNWKKMIEESEYFLALLTPGIFKEAEFTEQAIYAKQLQKKTIIVKLKGLETPSDWFENVIYETEFTDPEDMIKKLRNLTDEIVKTRNKKS